MLRQLITGVNWYLLSSPADTAQKVQTMTAIVKMEDFTANIFFRLVE